MCLNHQALSPPPLDSISLLYLVICFGISFNFREYLIGWLVWDVDIHSPNVHIRYSFWGHLDSGFLVWEVCKLSVQVYALQFKAEIITLNNTNIPLVLSWGISL